MYHRRRNRPSFMVVLTLVVLLGAAASLAVQAFAGLPSDTPAPAQVR